MKEQSHERRRSTRKVLLPAFLLDQKNRGWRKEWKEWKYDEDSEFGSIR